MRARQRLREAAYDWLRAAAPRYGSDEREMDALERAALEYAGEYWRHRAWCDAWLAIGLAATAVRWGGDGIIGWQDEQECRRVLAETVGRVVRRQG